MHLLKMLALLRFAARPARTSGAAFVSVPPSRSFANRPLHVGASREGADAERSAYAPHLDAPYFPIYFNDVYEVDMPPGHRFPMQKYRRVRQAVQSKVASLSAEEQQRVHCDFRVSPLATREQLMTTHDARYIHRYLTGDMPDAENRNIGFPWSQQHVNRTLSSVGGTTAAACAAWEEYLRRHEYLQRADAQSTTGDRPTSFVNEKTAHLCWGAHVAGGTHHAFKDYGEGFCIFSDIAVAANVLLQKYSEHKSVPIHRILIIDLDVHQGNGNSVLFDGDDRVQTFSMHCSANYFSKKEKSDLDVELPVGCDDETYLSTLRYWLRRIGEHQFDGQADANRKQFDLIFFQSGVDIHEEDRLGRLSVTASGISRRNSLVFEFADKMECPMIISMGGGYPRTDNWAPIIEAHAGVYWEAHQYLSNKCLQSNVDDPGISAEALSSEC